MSKKKWEETQKWHRERSEWIVPGGGEKDGQLLSSNWKEKHDKILTKFTIIMKDSHEKRKHRWIDSVNLVTNQSPIILSGTPGAGIQTKQTNKKKPDRG